MASSLELLYRRCSSEYWTKGRNLIRNLYRVILRILCIENVSNEKVLRTVIHRMRKRLSKFLGYDEERRLRKFETHKT